VLKLPREKKHLCTFFSEKQNIYKIKKGLEVGKEVYSVQSGKLLTNEDNMN